MTKSKSVSCSVMHHGEIASQHLLFGSSSLLRMRYRRGRTCHDFFSDAKLSLQNSELEKETDTDLAQGHDVLC